MKTNNTMKKPIIVSEKQAVGKTSYIYKHINRENALSICIGLALRNGFTYLSKFDEIMIDGFCEVEELEQVIEWAKQSNILFYVEVNPDVLTIPEHIKSSVTLVEIG